MAKKPSADRIAQREKRPGPRGASVLPEPPQPTSPADPNGQAWIDYVCRYGAGLSAASAEPNRPERELTTLMPERVFARIFCQSDASTSVPVGSPGSRIPIPGSEGLDRLLAQAPDGVFYEGRLADLVSRQQLG